ncbi:B12-binding domain-containing radical SAM protein, partial [Candidatus Omnitrophota bacterium]
VVCLNIRNEISLEEFRNKINDFNPSIVGFSCTSHQLKYLIKYSKELEKYTEILQIAGGVASTLDAEQILSRSSVKGACIGEGEMPLEHLLANIEKGQDISDTEGFYWSINNEIKKNRVPSFVPDLSVLDFPDYSIFEKNVVVREGNLLVMLSRGCPYNCHYCCNNALRSVYPSPAGYFRLPSVEYSIRLLERLINQYPETRFISSEDDLLIANKTWFKNFAEEYRTRINLPYRLCARVECITPDIIKALKYSGCKRISLGLESGNESLRSNLLNRKYSNNFFIEKTKLIKNADIDLFTFNIVGFPSEGKKEMNDTFKLNKEIKPDGGICTFFYPYKGTKLYKMCNEKNLLKTDDGIIEITNYNTRPSIKMSAKQEKQCIYFQKKILHYLDRQSELKEVRNLPFGIRKYLIAIYYWGRSTLKTIPWVYRIFKRLYRLLGIRVFLR